MRSLSRTPGSGFHPHMPFVAHAEHHWIISQSERGPRPDRRWSERGMPRRVVTNSSRDIRMNPTLGCKAFLMDSAPSFQPSPGEASLADPANFINRELSNIAFLERVLEEASDPRVALSERLRFLAILSATLDEFFMIRVAGLKQQISGRVEETGPDAMTPAEQLGVVSQRCHGLIERQDRVLLDELLPALEKAGMRLFRGNWPAAAQAAAAELFEREVLPVLTPLAIDPGHPFPHLRNKSVNLAIAFATPPRPAALRSGARSVAAPTRGAGARGRGAARG